jgi:hypothetical protein
MNSFSKANNTCSINTNSSAKAEITYDDIILYNDA